MLTRGSHGSVRARTRAYGSSHQAFATRLRVLVVGETFAGERLANSAIRCRFVDTVPKFLCTCRMSQHRLFDAVSRFPPVGPRRARVPHLRQYFQDTPTPGHPFRLTPVFVARRYHVLLEVRFVSLIATPSKTMSLDLVTRYSSREFRRGNDGAPKFLGNPCVHLRMFFDPGRATCRSPNRTRRAAPDMTTTKAPA